MLSASRLAAKCGPPHPPPPSNIYITDIPFTLSQGMPYSEASFFATSSSRHETRTLRHTVDDQSRVAVKVSYERGAWSDAEDDGLLSLVNELGAEHWDTIAKRHMVSRSGKQCRERWHNHVNPTILHTPFSELENTLIISLYNDIGTKWAVMSKRLKGRPANAIKNHFKANLSRRFTVNDKAPLLLYSNGLEKPLSGSAYTHELALERPIMLRKNSAPAVYQNFSAPSFMPTARPSFSSHGFYEHRGATCSAKPSAVVPSRQREPSHQQLDDIASTVVKHVKSSFSDPSHKAESLSSWQKVNGQRALPPLSLVLQSVRDLPQVANRPRAQSSFSGLPLSSGLPSTLNAYSSASSSSTCAKMTDMDEAQKAILPPPYRRSQSDTTIQQHTITQTIGTKRSISAFEVPLREHPRQRARDSPLEDRYLRPRLLSLSARHNQLHSNYASSSPLLSNSLSVPSFSPGGLSTPGSVLMTPSDLFRSPMYARDEGERHDYFSRSHPRGTDHDNVAPFHISNASFSAACSARADGKEAIANPVFGNYAAQSHRSPN